MVFSLAVPSRLDEIKERLRLMATNALHFVLTPRKAVSSFLHRSVACFSPLNQISLRHLLKNSSPTNLSPSDR